MSSRVADRPGKQAGFARAAALADGTARARGRAGYGLVSPGLVYLLVFFVLPVFTLLATSLYVKPPGAEVGQFVPALEFGNYAIVLGGYWSELLRSFGFALLATVLCLLIGYPMAYLIAVRLRGRAFVQGLLLVLLIAPFFTSFVLRTQAWKQILADEGFLVQALKTLHLLPQGASLTATSVAVVAGLTYNFLPFMVLPLYASLEKIDPRLLEAGNDLYASPFTTFRLVTVPLAMAGLLVSPGATYFRVERDGRHVGFASSTLDTTASEIHIDDLVVAEGARGARLEVRSGVRLTRALAPLRDLHNVSMLARLDRGRRA